MSDYIKREDAIEAFDPQQRQDWYTPWIVETLKDLPSADVAPVRHAHWVPLTDCSNAGIYCSWCHKKVYKDDYSNTMKMHSAHCPNCGAKMDEETK